MERLNRYRNLIALVGAMTLAHAALAIMVVATPLVLATRDVGPAGVGFVAALYGIGFILGALWAPRFIADVGHIRAFSFFAALTAVATLAVGGADGALGWGVLRLVAGACVAGLFAVGESWIAEAAPEDARGDILSVYVLVSRLGLLLGPFLIAGPETLGLGALMTAAAIFALALCPVAATRQAQPAPPSAERFDVMALTSVAPAAVAGALTAGFVNGSVLQLAPLYAANGGGGGAGAGAAAALNAAIMLGALVAQWPAGRLSDHRDRRQVIAGLAGGSAVAAFLLALTPSGAPGWWVFIAAAVWGGGAMSYYAVCIAHAADRAPAGQLTRVIAAMLVVWAAGAALGPLLAGLFMVAIGPQALFWLAAIAQGGLVFVMLRRRAEREEAPIVDKDAFAPVLATSAGFGALVDTEAVEAGPADMPGGGDEAPSDTRYAYDAPPVQPGETVGAASHTAQTQAAAPAAAGDGAASSKATVDVVAPQPAAPQDFAVGDVEDADIIADLPAERPDAVAPTSEGLDRADGPEPAAPPVPAETTPTAPDADDAETDAAPTGDTPDPSKTG